jgi:replicative DNA helicase
MSIVEMIKNSVGSKSRLKYFAKRVRQGYYLRMARNEFSGVISAIDNCADDSMIGDIAELVESAVKNLIVETDKKMPVIASQLAENYMDVLQNRYEGGEHDKRLKFGIEAIDEMTGGVNPSDLIVMAGCPGMGKTELMVTLSNAASSSDSGSLLFSLEMSESELIERSIAIEACISITDLRNPRGMGDEEWQKVTMGIGTVKGKKFHVLDSAGLTINEIFAQSIDHKTRHPETNLICVDYAGLVDTSNYQDQVRALGEVGKKLKELAKKIQTPVILLSQVVSKDVEKRADKRPMASDLKGSSELQDAADWIIFPYRDVVYHDDSPCAEVAEVIFAKARHGKQGTAYMSWKNGHFTPTDQAFADSLVKQAKSPAVKQSKNF